MTRFFTCLVSLSLAAQAVAQSASDWPQFLGPQRNGVSPETGLIETWPQGGPREVWRVKGGVGMSGLAVSRGRLVTMVQSSGKQNVICLQAKTGKTIWQTPVAPQYENPQGDGPRATPTIAGDLVLTFTGEGMLVALRLADGGVVWSRDGVAERGGKPADYGMASSPLVVENMTVVHVGAPQATVAAYDTRSGEPLWTSGKAEAAGYSSPQWLDVGGRRQVVSFTGGSVQGLAAETGDVLWRHPYVTDFHCNIAAPLAYDGRVFISAGENHGSVLLDLKPQGETFQVSEVWSSQGTGSVLRNEWQTSILLDG
ncbi:MAG: PQQ-like beta-propeller repeat protein, partial [Planctomycetales bacterium]|nr:PQQ-like beta-propeller repeat protein [Planctomycetales bacterium]